MGAPAAFRGGGRGGGRGGRGGRSFGGRGGGGRGFRDEGPPDTVVGRSISHLYFLCTNHAHTYDIEFY